MFRISSYLYHINVGEYDMNNDYIEKLLLTVELNTPYKRETKNELDTFAIARIDEEQRKFYDSVVIKVLNNKITTAIPDAYNQYKPIKINQMLKQINEETHEISEKEFLSLISYFKKENEIFKRGDTFNVVQKKNSNKAINRVNAL